ncbi:MAG TPA: VgrG-related protein, partial [Ktedonobacteraceae bacterium]|nr:VgrG-related protein [Ktedonobacteraceae bacterium]
PGKALKVQVKVERQQTLLFDGEIVEIEPRFTTGAHELVIRAFDRLYKLLRGRQVRSFVNVSDADIINKIADEVGLSAQVGSASIVYPYVFQNNESNLAFLQKRAAALGFLLYVKEKTLYCEPLDSSSATVNLQWNKNLREFYPRLTTMGQVDTVNVRGWDPAQKQAVTGQASKKNGAPEVGQVNEAFLMGGQTLVANRPIREQSVAEELAKATANQVAGRFIEADGTCEGTPALVAGVSAQITSVGNRFSGKYFVTNTVHVYNASQGYITHFTVSGHHPSTLFAFLTQPEEVETQPGLVIGLVTDNQDPLGQGRVKVKYPWLTEEHASDWARVIAPGTGNQRGIQFLPEVNDEVLVGFEMGDIHCPYVLGGLWNGKDKLPKDVVSGGNVQQRLIRSRTGHMITLDDSEGGGGITIEDSAGNKLVLDTQQNKLTITVKGDMELKAQGNMTLQAQGNLTLQAQAEAQLKANMGVQVDAGAATVNVKGSLINLN